MFAGSGSLSIAIAPLCLELQCCKPQDPCHKLISKYALPFPALPFSGVVVRLEATERPGRSSFRSLDQIWAMPRRRVSWWAYGLFWLGIASKILRIYGRKLTVLPSLGTSRFLSKER